MRNLLVALVVLFAPLQVLAAPATTRQSDPSTSRPTESRMISIRNLAGESYKVEVDLTSETVASLRGKISSREAPDSRLIFAGKQLTDDQRLLTDYGIQKDSVIILIKPPGGSPKDSSNNDRQKITITTITGSSFELDHTGKMTVAELKGLIEDKLGVSATQQMLIYEGKELRSDSQSLAECNVRPGASLTLSVKLESGILGHRTMGELTNSEDEEASAEDFIAALAQAIFEEEKFLFEFRFRDQVRSTYATRDEGMRWVNEQLETVKGILKAEAAAVEATSTQGTNSDEQQEAGATTERPKNSTKKTPAKQATE